MIRFTLRHPLLAAQDALDAHDRAVRNGPGRFVMRFPGTFDALDRVRARAGRRLLPHWDRDRLAEADRAFHRQFVEDMAALGAEPWCTLLRDLEAAEAAGSIR